MRKYLIVVELTEGFPCYYESLSRNALDHIKRENFFKLDDDEAFKERGASEVNVIDLSSNEVVSGAKAVKVGNKRECRRKSREEIGQLNKSVGDYLDRVYEYGTPF